MASSLLKHARGRAVIGDSGYDSNAFIKEIRAEGLKPVICPNPTRKNQVLKLDKKLYRERFMVEVFFHNLKRFRAIATRFDKTARNYLGLLHLACAFLLIN